MTREMETAGDFAFELSPSQVEAAVKWWGEQWIPADSRDAFRAALRSVLSDSDSVKTAGTWTASNGGTLYLRVDYDPDQLLLLAVLQVRPCAGCLFSAREIFPYKTRMRISRAVVEVEEREAPDFRFLHWKALP